MTTDEKEIAWKIGAIRDAISLDWQTLASRNLASEQRKAFREHLAMNVSALHDLVERNRSALKKSKLDSVV
jgi:hypothetical protein